MSTITFKIKTDAEPNDTEYIRETLVTVLEAYLDILVWETLLTSEVTNTEEDTYEDN